MQCTINVWNSLLQNAVEDWTNSYKIGSSVGIKHDRAVAHKLGLPRSLLREEEQGIDQS